MLDHFAKEKLDFLKKKDKSRKGHIDKDAVKVVNELNSKRDCYTTSSCAGRIVLLEVKSKKKNECSWILTKHEKVSVKEIMNSLDSHKNNKNPIWFKQQPLILHVACRDINAANKLLEISRKIFRRAGVIGVTARRVMVEIIGDERIETIIAGWDFVADECYLKGLVRHANKNFAENKMKSERFLRAIKL